MSNWLINFWDLITRKSRIIGHKFLTLGRCHKCLVLEEQLDIERERIDRLLVLFSEGTVSDKIDETEKDEEESKHVPIRENKSWAAQRARLSQRAREDYKKYIEKQRATGTTGE